MSDTECPVCGSDEEYDIVDAKECVQCRRTVCSGCIQWYGEDHDDANGEWYCDECISIEPPWGDE